MKAAFGIGAAVLVAAFLYFVVDWEVNRVYVNEGQSLMLRYKGPLLFGARKDAASGSWASEGEIGVLAKLRGPGRHFYCPIWWERTVVDDIIVKPGEVGVVTCKLGQELSSGDFLVDGDIGTTTQKGILRKVLHPGTYRVNPYGYTVEIVRPTGEKNAPKAGWVEIPTGAVGVVTNLTANPMTGAKAGISDNVLPPGIYPINGREQHIDIVKIGFRHSTISVAVVKDGNGQDVKDENGEPKIADEESGIQFPSSDGFPIHMDFTTIWGLMPDQAPHAIRTIGNVDAVEQKIVLPQVHSILRNNGSEYRAVQLLVGNDREKYQNDSVKEFHSVLDAKKISLLYGLVRHVYIPEQVRKPIQMSFIAQELTLTREQQQDTTKEEAKLREAEAQVGLASGTVEAETRKLVAERTAEGARKAKAIEAQTTTKVAEIARRTATLLAEAQRVLGEAQNKGKKLKAEAESDRFRLAVAAFGSPEAYNNWIFATALPDDVKLDLLYAGEGTLWTDRSLPITGTIPVKPEKKSEK